MIKVIISLITEATKLLRQFTDPKARKEIISIAKGKYADKALIKANAIIAYAREIKGINKEMITLLKQPEDNTRKIAILQKRADRLWDKIDDLDREYRRLLVLE